LRDNADGALVPNVVGKAKLIDVNGAPLQVDVMAAADDAVALLRDYALTHVTEQVSLEPLSLLRIVKEGVCSCRPTPTRVWR
jgi:hypothetical protein